MPPRDYLPQLPLMLAAIPRTVGELLRDAGLPATPLPEVPLGVNTVGRFVLFDSRSAQSQARARRAAGQGLELIDLGGFFRQRGAVSFSLQRKPDAPENAQTRTHFLHWLKKQLEERGGVWLRISDFPFPFQSALCISISHPSRDPRVLKDHVEVLGKNITQFVPATRHSATTLHPGQFGDLGLRLDSTAWDSSQLLPILREMAAAGHRPCGILSDSLPQSKDLSRELWSLGIRMACRANEQSWYRTTSAVAQEPWTLFGLVSMAENAEPRLSTTAGRHPHTSHTPQESFESRLTAHYYRGSPLFAHADSTQSSVHHWGRQNTERNPWPLLWRTPLGEFARWLRWRRTLSFQVRRVGNQWEIETPSQQNRFPCALELWRGSHMALFPMRERRISIAEDGLAFVQQIHRSPVGIATDFPKSPAASLESARAKVA